MYLAKESGRARSCGLVPASGAIPSEMEENVLQEIIDHPATPPDGYRLVVKFAT